MLLKITLPQRPYHGGKNGFDQRSAKLPGVSKSSGETGGTHGGCLTGYGKSRHMDSDDEEQRAPQK
jgi:hypothetical protein